jgi:hypothetical protein
VKKDGNHFISSNENGERGLRREEWEFEEVQEFLL